MTGDTMGKERYCELDFHPEGVQQAVTGFFRRDC